MHYPKDLSYPLLLCKILEKYGKIPSSDIDNPYENNVCEGNFIGSVHTCKS